jgi:hypothetical protein
MHIAKGHSMKAVYITLFCAFYSVSVGMPDPGVPDSVWIDSVGTFPGQQATLPVYFCNDELLTAVELVVSYDTTYLKIDSFSLTGGRLDYIDNSSVVFLDSADLINLLVMDWTSGFISEGRGRLCNLFFTAKANSGGHTIVIDNDVWPAHYNPRTTRFSDESATSFIYPIFLQGHVTINELPPNFDSVWVDRKVGVPGETVAVNVGGYNEENLSKVYLALKYSSNSLTYVNTIFDNTRGQYAQKKLVSPPDTLLRQMLITLEYTESNPLPPGSGPLATVLFVIDSAAANETVTIDSVSYLNAQPIEFVPSDTAAGEAFTPYFSSGFVRIEEASDVDLNTEKILPERFTLFQNTPNPFNPSTFISFELPCQSPVRLDIFNILGQKVITLINKTLPAGRYEVNFDGRDSRGKVLASGVYLYRLEAGEFAQSMKMTLLK